MQIKFLVFFVIYFEFHLKHEIGAAITYFHMQRNK